MGKIVFYSTNYGTQICDRIMTGDKVEEEENLQNIAVGLVEEINHAVYVSLISRVLITSKSRHRQRIVSDFTNWNLLILLHECVASSLTKNVDNYFCNNIYTQYFRHKLH